MTSPPPVRTPLALIRAALLGGVLLFGLVSWVTIRQRGGGPLPGIEPAALGVFRVLVPALCLAAIGAAVAIRLAVARATEPARRNSLRIIGWATGEAAALAGGVYYFEVGDPKLYLIGLTAMLATFIVVPIRET